MRFIIYGAGGVGGVIGAQLFSHHHDVVLIARGDHLRAVQENGLRYETPDSANTLAIPAVDHPEKIEFQTGDVVILTMKTQHTVDALETLRAVAGDGIPVICCQNGVSNEEMALRRFSRVYGMLVYLPAVLLEPGLVLSHAANCKGVLDAGCYPGGTDELITQVTENLQASGFSAGPVDDVMRWKYGKLLLNLGNSVQALCRLDETDKPALRQLRGWLRDEAEASLKKAGIAWSSRIEEKARREGLMNQAAIAGRPRGGGSSWQSIMRGTGNIEADYLNGEIVRLGRLHGVPVHANAVLQRLVNELARSKGKAQAMAPADVCAMIEREQAAAMAD